MFQRRHAFELRQKFWAVLVGGHTATVKLAPHTLPARSAEARDKFQIDELLKLGLRGINLECRLRGGRQGTLGALVLRPETSNGSVISSSPVLASVPSPDLHAETHNPVVEVLHTQHTLPAPIVTPRLLRERYHRRARRHSKRSMYRDI